MSIEKIKRFLKRSYFKVTIIKDRPFSNLIKVTPIEDLISYRDGILMKSIRAFKVQDFNKLFYKLRVYNSIDYAKQRETKIRLAPQFFLKFYGRYKNYLLLDFLQGTTLVNIKDPSLDIFFKIGEMCGEINKLKINGKKEAELSFHKQIKYILRKKVISAEDYSIILRTYEKLTQKIEHDIVLEIFDITRNNFMIDSQNKVYFIDEDGIDYKVKGFGFVEPLLRWFNKEQKKIFFEGYNAVNSTAFFNSDYEKFVYFLYYVEKIWLRIRAVSDYSDMLKRLLEFVYSEKIK